PLIAVRPPITQDAPLVLGSGSPRRREILGSLGVPFTVLVADADERVLAGEEADAYLARVVRLKLAAVPAKAQALRASAILVADTSVIVDGAILGKPESDAGGLAMIERLAGRAHEVHTRFAIGDVAQGGVWHEETAVTQVTFRVLFP